MQINQKKSILCNRLRPWILLVGLFGIVESSSPGADFPPEYGQVVKATVPKELRASGSNEGYFYTSSPVAVFAYEADCSVVIRDIFNPDPPAASGVAAKWMGDDDLYLYEATLSAGYYYITVSKEAGVLVGVSSLRTCNGYYHYRSAGGAYENDPSADIWFLRATGGCDSSFYVYTDVHQGSASGWWCLQPPGSVDFPQEPFSVSVSQGYHDENPVGNLYAELKKTSGDSVMLLARDGPGYFVPPREYPGAGTSFVTFLGDDSDEYLNIHCFEGPTGYFVKRYYSGGSHTLASGVLDEGETATIRNTSYASPNEMVEVLSTAGRMSVSVLGGGTPADTNYMTFALDRNGKMQGTDFITRSHATGYILATGLDDDTIVEVRNAETDALQSTHTLNEGWIVNVNPAGGVWRIRADKDITVCVGQGYGGTFIPLTQWMSGSTPFAPVIMGVHHNPEYPRTQFNSSIQVRWLTDELTTSKLHYKIADGDWQTISSIYYSEEHSKTIDISSLTEQTEIQYSVEVTDHSGNTVVDDNEGANYQVTVYKTAPDLDVTLDSVQYVDPYYQLNFSIQNNGYGKAKDVELRATLAGMQPFNEQVWANYDNIMDAWIRVTLSIPQIPVGLTAQRSLKLMPYLNHLGDVDYKMTSVSTVCKDGLNNNYTNNYPSVTYDWSDTTVETRMADTRYVVFANPYRFYDLFPQKSLDVAKVEYAQKMPKSMASFAIERDATLVYTSGRNVYNIHDYIQSCFRGKIDESWLGGGYLLLVGCSFVFPSLEINLECDDDSYHIVVCDNYYANTNEDSKDKPELCVGRITGDHPSHYVNLFERATSPIVYYHKAVCISGRGDGEASFANNAEQVETRLDDLYDSPSTHYYRLKAVADIWSSTPIDYFETNKIFEGMDFLYYRNHGSKYGWGSLPLKGWDLGNLTFGNRYPIVYSNTCLTGQITTSWNFAEAFLAHCAANYIGATEESPRGPNNKMGKLFANRHRDGKTLGQAFRRAKRKLAGDISGSNTCVTNLGLAAEILMYNLYGDPLRAGTDPLVTKPGKATLSYDTPTTPIEISLPMYEVETGEDELDHVTIPAGEEGDVLIQINEPIVPVYYWTATYEPGVRVNQVSLASRTTMTTATGLELPTAWGNEKQSPGPGDVPSPGTFPAQDFHWDTSELPDGSLEFELTVYPFFHNAQTQDSTYYQDFSFDIDFVESTVEILSATTEYNEVPAGGSQTINVKITNTNLIQSKTVDLSVEIRNKTTQDLVETLSQSSILLSGSFRTQTISLPWSTSGQPYTHYQVTARVEDSSNGDEYDVAYTTFKVGVADITMTKFWFTTDTAGVLDDDEDLPLEMDIQNTGDIPVDGTRYFQIRRVDDGLIFDEWEAGFSSLSVGSTLTYDHNWGSTGIPPGEYQYVGWVMYTGGVTDIYTKTFRTIEDMRLGMELPQDVYGHGDKIMMTADRYELDGMVIPPGTVSDLDVQGPGDTDYLTQSLDQHSTEPYHSTFFIVSASEYSGAYTMLLTGEYPGYRPASATRSFVVTDNPFTMSAAPAVCPADGESTITVTSGDIYRWGSLISDGTYMTLRPSTGVITTPDASGSFSGVQVATSGGQIEFEWQAPTENTPYAFVSSTVAIYMFGEVVPISGLTVNFKGVDFNNNQRVDVSDILFVESSEGAYAGTGFYDLRKDMDEDGTVDASDTQVLEDRWALEFADAVHCSTCKPDSGPFGVTLRPVPEVASLMPGGTLSIDIVADGLDSLGGFEFGAVLTGDAMSWNGAPQQTLALEANGNTQHDLGPVAYDDGYRLGAYATGDEAGPDGRTIIATMSLHADQYGETKLILSSPLFVHTDSGEMGILRVEEGTYTVAQATPTPTNSPTATPTETPTQTQSPTATATETATHTPVPTATATPTATNVPPEIHLECDPVEGTAPLHVALIGSATDPDGFLIQYGWAFEDSQVLDATATIASATVEAATTHIYYASPGLYEAGFWVWDDRGAVVAATGEISVWTPVSTSTATSTSTPTATQTATCTKTPEPTGTPTRTPTDLPTETRTPPPTLTNTPTATASATLTPTPTETRTQLPTATQIPGDTNRDGQLNALDLFYFCGYWQQSATQEHPCNCVPDDRIDESDLIYLLKEWED